LGRRIEIIATAWNPDMDKWLKAALDYIPDWIALQMRLADQPGCVIAIAHKGQIVLEQAFGVADLGSGEKMTPRHRFRIASHSKSFTAAGIMKLREQGRLKLDDPVGAYVKGLNPEIAQATIAQLLSHSAGLIRDGADSGQFIDRRPFYDASQLMADFAKDPAIAPNTRFKYSNHGFGLVGLVIQAVVAEPYRSWIKREIVNAAGLKETEPDMPLANGTPFAPGHGSKLLLGRRAIIPGDYATHAIAPAAGFVSTASDVARFFGQLSPLAKTSALSVASRREMTRPQWRNPHSGVEEHYGLGIKSGSLGGWDYFGHGGSLQGYISCTSVLPKQDLSICVLTNASNGWAGPWVEGAIHILREFSKRGAPSRKLRDWNGRWWGFAGAADLVAMGDIVLIADPQAWNPFAQAAEIEMTGKDKGRIVLANGYASHGEKVRRIRDNAGDVTEVWLAGWKLLPEAQVIAEMQARYETAPPAQETAAAVSKPRARRSAKRTGA
jgi:CubicO group peptidase (beta-lactamase class C family)